MKKDIAQLWTSALRSGEFTQAKGYLDKGQSQCILGVLVQIAMTYGTCDYTPVRNYGAYDGELGRIPKSVQNWAEMYGQNGEIRGEFVNLTGMNDLYDWDFLDLASFIEENYERL